MFAKEDLLSAEWTGAVHRALLTQPPETRLTEHMATRVHLEGLVEDVKTHGAEKVLMDLGQFRLSLKKLLIHCHNEFVYLAYIDFIIPKVCLFVKFSFLSAFVTGWAAAARQTLHRTVPDYACVSPPPWILD